MVGSSSAYYLGEFVAGAGDVNGDGFDDVMVSISSYTDKVSIYHGARIGVSPTATTTLSLSNNVTSVAPAGDVDDDGYDDVVVGTSGYSSSTGQAYLYQGTASGVSNTVATALTGESSSDYFGCSVAGAGDVNNDGYDSATSSPVPATSTTTATTSSSSAPTATTAPVRSTSTRAPPLGSTAP